MLQSITINAAKTDAVTNLLMRLIKRYLLLLCLAILLDRDHF
jgi:hypothetical protein